MSDSRYDLFLLSQEMRATPEFAQIQRLDRFTNTLQLFEANFLDLSRVMSFICDSTAGEQIFRHENRSAWEQAVHEVIRLLHNFVASACTLVDHSRVLYHKTYESSGQFEDYPNEVAARFSKSEIVQFVHGLRNYCLHYQTPAIGTTLTLVDSANEIFERRITLSKDRLFAFKWNKAAKAFLDGSPAHIDLRETLAAYHSGIKMFYEWFFGRVRVLHAGDLGVISRFYSSLLSGKREENLRSLNCRLKAFEAGVGTPMDVLNPFMTPADAAKISCELGNPHQ